MERDGEDGHVAIATGDFNSHAHVERDITAFDRMLERKISTHTLTWSVTDYAQIFVNTHKFQLTRSRGA